MDKIIHKVTSLIARSELMRMFQQAGMFHYDLTGVEQTGLKHLNITAVSSYFQRYDIDLDDEEDLASLLMNTGLSLSVPAASPIQ